MGSTPTVSVITATYHWPEALRFAIRSVLDQTFECFEYIVVGDGCTDGTQALVKSFDDPRVRWLNLTENSGNQAAPNAAGLRAARGRLVAYLGHDDLWLPNHLETLVAAIDAADADIAWSVASLVGSRGAHAATGLFDPARDEPFPFAPPSSLMHRRDVAEEVGGWGDPDALGVPFDHEFGERLWRHRFRAARSGRLTTLKFPATWFPDSYVEQTARVQAQAYERMVRLGPAFAEDLLLQTLQAVESAEYVAAVGVAPEPQAPGEIVRANRLRKGAARFGEHERTAAFSLDLSRPVHALREWHGPEHHPTHGSFQWTGPSRTTTVQVPLDRRSVLQLRISVISALAPTIVDSLEVRIDDETLELRRVEDNGATLLFGTISPSQLPDPAPATRIVLKVAEVLRPCDLDPNDPDARELGLAISGFVVERHPSLAM